MGRSPCCSKVGLRRGPWSTKEDTLLANFIQENGEGQWRSLPKKAGLLRCGKSCRLRWMNYLRPGIKRGNISQDEEDLIVRLHGLLGNRWSLIAGRLPGRTDNEIKNYWNTYLLKKLNNAGIHTKPHKDLPKFKKAAASGTVAKKPKKLKRIAKADADNKVDGSDHLQKTKVYWPKAIRISPAFSRTDSLDSLMSGFSSSDGTELAAEGGGRKAEASFVPMAWPVLESEVGNYEVCGGGGGDDDLLDGYCVLPLPQSYSSSDVFMLDQVYEDYLQLL